MNPLQKYFRQPKIYIQLPSKGAYYPEGVLIGDSQNVPICAMTGMDELIMKTPDALFNGEATVKLIQSCCPYITDAHHVPSIDVDMILAAIRIATFGDELPITHTCGQCGEKNEYDIPTQSIIDYYNNKSFDASLDLGEIVIFFRPLTYEEMSKFNINNFTLQQLLKQVNTTEDTKQRQEILDRLYTGLAEIQSEIFIYSIDSIKVDDVNVYETEYIREWIRNCDRDYYDAIKQRIENNKKEWDVPRTGVKCVACGNEEDVRVILDQSHFFV